MTTTRPTWMTPAEAAEYLRCHVETVYDRLVRGTVPGVKIGKRWYVDEDALLAMFPSQRGEP